MRIHEVLSVPPVGHGNPAVALALQRQAEQIGLDVRLISLETTAPLARLAHRRMTRDPERARRYISDPGRRTGPLSIAYAIASAHEFASRVGDASPVAWTTVQEHALLGASPRALEQLGVVGVRLATPDVSPKESGVAAARKHHELATVFVWNAITQRLLRQRGIKTELTAPYLDRYHGYHDLPQKGLPVVAKTSGSGFPLEWRRTLHQALMELSCDWAFHTPEHRHTPSGSIEKPDSLASIHSYYSDVGDDTQAIICYPSEQVGLVCGRNERGKPTWMIALPPRGTHEYENLVFARDQGVLWGELVMDNGSAPTLPGTRVIPVGSLTQEIVRLGNEQPNWRPSVIGQQPFWEVAQT
ncbi:MAG TPA: hypothetical protein VGS28_02305 [Candidatus Saccharimonadales bacterium]|nr:hypothetical protein [Candidatus Saccharimonadales bacterium]